MCRTDADCSCTPAVGLASVVVRPRAAGVPSRWARTSAPTRSASRQRKVIQKSTVEDWLPRYESVSGGSVDKGLVGCENLSRPATYSGTSMLTVLSFDLAGADLGDGLPTTIVADGDTVYSNRPSLYVASDQRWRMSSWDFGRARGARPVDQSTEIYRFDTSAPGRPRFLASGSVPGWLVNQYAMSEGTSPADRHHDRAWHEDASSSAVLRVRTRDDALVQTGKLTGSQGERIYAVRFAGTIGYVVTFRQETRSTRWTCPTLGAAGDRRAEDSGYSAYLHPAEPVGSSASARSIGSGTVQGRRCPLFDVSDLSSRPAAAAPCQAGTRKPSSPPRVPLLARRRLLVVPLVSYAPNGFTNSGALVLRVTALVHRGGPRAASASRKVDLRATTPSGAH